MSAPSQNLVKWLTRMLADITDAGAIGRFELIHKIEGEHAERLDIWRSDADSPRSPDELGQEMQDAAQRDAQSRVSGLPQRYVVYAFRAQSEEHESQHAFLVRPGSHLSRLGEDSEPPNDKGVIGQSMRHSEQVHRLLITGGDVMIGRLASELERERDARVKAEQLNWSVFEKYQSLLDREHERRVVEAKELMKARRVDELMGVVTALVPILATKLLGGSPARSDAPQLGAAADMATDPKDLAVRHFFSRLSETEITSILGAISSSSQIALAQIHSSFTGEQQSPADVMARQLAIRKFLKMLSEQEIKSILASLSEQNRQLLIALYAQYRDLEEQEQARKPEILRS
ncbi:MAG TPA: hypothetical protein VJN18_02735 [Polyangiaceae bacterium]|nr:hypothetical protein [Polyangiaceae bacterium]